MKVKDRFIYRHKILQYLYDKVKHQPMHQVDLKKSWTDFEEIATYLNIDPFILREYHEGLHSLDDNQIKCEPRGTKFFIAIEEAGIYAYLDEYWLREGEKEVNERIYQKTKWSIPIIAIIISVVSLSISTCNSGNKSGISRDVSQTK